MGSIDSSKTAKHGKKLALSNELLEFILLSVILGWVTIVLKTEKNIIDQFNVLA